MTRQMHSVRLDVSWMLMDGYILIVHFCGHLMAVDFTLSRHHKPHGID